MGEISGIILGLHAAGWDDTAIVDFLLWIGTGEKQYLPPQRIHSAKKDRPYVTDPF